MSGFRSKDNLHFTEIPPGPMEIFRKIRVNLITKDINKSQNE